MSGADNQVELFPGSDAAEDREARASFDRSIVRHRRLVAELIEEVRRSDPFSFDDKARALFRAGFRCGYIAAKACGRRVQ